MKKLPLCFALFFLISFVLLGDTFANEDEQLGYSTIITINSAFSGLQVGGEQMQFNFSVPSSGLVQVNYCSTVDNDKGSFEDDLSGALRSTSWNTVNRTIELSRMEYLSKGDYYYFFTNSADGSFEIELLFTPCVESFPETTGGQNNTISTANAIELHNNYYGLISSDDPFDIYSFEIGNIGDFSIEINMMAVRSHLYTELYNSDSELIHSDSKYYDSTFGETGTFTYTSKLDEGKYYLSIGSLTGGGNYSLKISQIEKYVIQYDSNCGTGAPEQQSKTVGSALTLSNVCPVRKGYTFLGWATDREATIAEYQPGDSYTDNASITLYAVWKELEHIWDEGEENKASTCTNAGEITYTCTICGETRSETIEAVGHTPTRTVHENVASEIGTETGSYEEVVYCAICGVELSRETVDPDKPAGIWIKDSAGWWYDNGDGTWPANEWKQIDGVWYYFKSSGYMAANEWCGGYWLDASGAWTYQPRGSWHQDAAGWWYGDSSGWYARNQWQVIDGVWYYFGPAGYMAAGEWYGGYWLGASGAWTYQPRGSWVKDAVGWWFGDTSGWYAKNETVRINGVDYAFDAAGYWVE